MTMTRVTERIVTPMGGQSQPAIIQLDSVMRFTDGNAEVDICELIDSKMEGFYRSP
jgi:hypothetical protein